MIRLGKPVQLFEWGVGTNTMNQNWNMIGKGVLRNAPKWFAGATTLIVEIDGTITRKNEKENMIKVCQPGEGMTPNSEHFGEVATGTLKSIKQEGSKTIVEIQLEGAAKVG
jgi:hypothetical protein